MSKNIAVAGAGALGKHVVDALLESKEFKVTVLSRSPKPELESRGAIVKVVDYRYPSQLITALKGCDTLLSFIVDLVSPNGSLGALAHRNLLTAAIHPDVKLKRFVPAEYANDIARFPVPPAAEKDKLYFREYIRQFCPARGIEYTLVSNGILMDFFRPKGKKGGFPDLEGPLVPINAEERKALVLGNKEDKISFTAAYDVAQCLVRLLKVEIGGWDEYTYVSGDRLTWEQAAQKLEGVLGEKVERTYIGVEELRERVAEAKKGGDGMKIMAAELNEAFGDGSEVLPENSKLFDGVKFLKLEQLFKECYGKGA
ncbi:putative NAD(P)-binding domain-containing protein [Seiridium unicorne]|uniref:NAD(P)-binding domain-containing protein n=1 Tax=Seiridium unicorne TaxID=138068 RepID=A0ABR2UR81_9PEZI